MNGHLRHPGTEELAEFRAGVTHGARGDLVAAHIAECPDCASLSEQLGQVSAMLAAIPAPAIPGDIEARITSVLAAESARRAGNAASTATPSPVSSPAEVPPPSITLPSSAPAAASASGSPESTSPVPLAAGSLPPAAARRRAWRRKSVAAPVGVLAAAAACLALAFVGYRVSGTGHPAASSAAGGSARSQRAGGNIPVSGGPSMRRDNLSPAVRPSTPPFVVQVSTVNFHKTTLQAQVSQQLATERGLGGTGTHSPAGHATSQPGHNSHSVPPNPLVGCVMRVTGHIKPTLVESADYQSRPVYVIAVPAHAWVVARGCTAAYPEVLASVPLPASRLSPPSSHLRESPSLRIG